MISDCPQLPDWKLASGWTVESGWRNSTTFFLALKRSPNEVGISDGVGEIDHWLDNEKKHQMSVFERLIVG